MKFDRIIKDAVSDLSKIRECESHEWTGAVKKVEWADGHTFYEVACKHCPLGKMFENEQEALAAIGEKP